MTLSQSLVSQKAVTVRSYEGRDLGRQLPRWEAYVARGGQVPLSFHPGWLAVLEQALGHVPYALEAVEGDKIQGFLALAYVRSWLFGRFLVSLPYLNYGGVVAADDAVARLLINQAVDLAGALRVRYLELRHDRVVEHPALAGRRADKVHMRLALPGAAGQLWDRLAAKVRNQVRKGQKNGLAVAWGGAELVPEFYAVFSRNMRDLGTPVYGRGLFRAVLRQFPGRAELCVVRAGDQPVAGALLLHGWAVTEVPSASSLRQFNHTNANMLMYWHLLERAIQRGQAVFDFGRSTVDGNTYRFKKQWGAEPRPAEWQYHLRTGSAADLRPDNPRYQRLIGLWQRLPVGLTRWVGPAIVRGIP
jgi:FemAB-related protein (PEP-CTERM system-associated)